MKPNRAINPSRQSTAKSKSRVMSSKPKNLFKSQNRPVSNTARDPSQNRYEKTTKNDIYFHECADVTDIESLKLKSIMDSMSANPREQNIGKIKIKFNNRQKKRGLSSTKNKRSKTQNKEYIGMAPGTIYNKIN